MKNTIDLKTLDSDNGGIRIQVHVPRFEVSTKCFFLDLPTAIRIGGGSDGFKRIGYRCFGFIILGFGFAACWYTSASRALVARLREKAP